MSRARALLLSLTLLAPATAHAQAASEAAVKAAFLVKFGAYVSWPETEGPITICAVGRDGPGAALERAAAGQQVDGRAIEIRKLDAIDRNSGCDIAYLAGSASQPVAAAMAALRSTPVLTVTDSRWSKVRGMVHFQIASSRVRFHIDERAAAESRIGISSKLLALALSVRMRTNGG